MNSSFRHRIFHLVPVFREAGLPSVVDPDRANCRTETAERQNRRGDAEELDRPGGFDLLHDKDQSAPSSIRYS